MSGKHKKVSREEKLRRRLQRGDRALVHGICRGECSRRRILILPARLCQDCLMQAIADEYEPPTAEQVLADPFMEEEA